MRSEGGFTIIETTLFLAVTGVLILMIIVGTGNSLNVQRYRDSVESFKSVVQQQYSSLSSVQNGRQNTWNCDSTSSIRDSGNAGQIRGQSRCVLAGKYMRIDGNNISIYTVLARQTGTSQTDDIQTMAQNYAMNVVTNEVEERTIEWGSQIAWAKPGTSLDSQANPTPRTLGILFVRSPKSGQTYTFTSNTIPQKNNISQATFTDLIVGGDRAPGKQGARMVCLVSGGLFANGDMGIYIAPFAASANAIEVRTNDNARSIAEDIKC